MTPKEQAALAQDPVVAALRDRVLKRGGFDFFPYIAKKTGRPWTSVPAGFKFQSNDPAGLSAKLLRSPRFGRDRVSKTSIREVSQPDSIHVRIDANGACTIHLDSVSPVDPAGKDSQGYVVYKDMPTLLRHISVDLMHLDQGPIEMPMDNQNRGDF